MPDLKYLKHRPVVLLPYADHDGMYAGDTDCRYLSLGWAQWDPRTLSVKALRYTERTSPDGKSAGRWSRQSEELPLHRALDAALLIASAVAQDEGAQSMILSAGTLEQQDQPQHLSIEVENASDRRKFETELHDPLVLRRLSKLADTLLALREAGQL